MNTIIVKRQATQNTIIDKRQDSVEHNLAV